MQEVVLSFEFLVLSYPHTPKICWAVGGNSKLKTKNSKLVYG